MARQYTTRDLAKSLTKNKSFQREMYKAAEKQFKKQKAQLIRGFNRHPVTKEIEGGRGASNISGTLGGYGNLYTYIGFVAGSNPIGAVRRILESRTKLGKITKRGLKGKKFQITIEIKTPSEGEITAASPLPWEGGRSWVYGIERGISGFGFYIYKKWKTSRSGKGIQSKKKVRGGTLQRRGYLSEVWRDFAKKIR